MNPWYHRSFSLDGSIWKGKLKTRNQWPTPFLESQYSAFLCVLSPPLLALAMEMGQQQKKGGKEAPAGHFAQKWMWMEGRRDGLVGWLDHGGGKGWNELAICGRGHAPRDPLPFVLVQMLFHPKFLFFLLSFQCQSTNQPKMRGWGVFVSLQSFFRPYPPKWALVFLPPFAPAFFPFYEPTKKGTRPLSLLPIIYRFLVHILTSALG
jgi:hypothetical protein